MLLISDANILIDMEVADLLSPTFQLEETFAVPDVLYSEELENDHAYLVTLGLQIMPLTDAGVTSAMQLMEIYNGPSRNDIFALELARENGCPLLTGDKALREAAEQEGIERRGTLWLVEQLVRKRFISLKRAEQAYAIMRNEGRRLPWEAVTKQLRELQDCYD